MSSELVERKRETHKVAIGFSVLQECHKCGTSRVRFEEFLKIAPRSFLLHGTKYPVATAEPFMILICIAEFFRLGDF